MWPSNLSNLTGLWPCEIVVSSPLTFNSISGEILNTKFYLQSLLLFHHPASWVHGLDSFTPVWISGEKTDIQAFEIKAHGRKQYIISIVPAILLSNFANTSQFIKRTRDRDLANEKLRLGLWTYKPSSYLDNFHDLVTQLLEFNKTWLRAKPKDGHQSSFTEHSNLFVLYHLHRIGRRDTAYLLNLLRSRFMRDKSSSYGSSLPSRHLNSQIRYHCDRGRSLNSPI